MESRAKLLGHPIHQMLIVLPLGFLSGAVLFDVVYLITDHVRWCDLSFWLIVAGIISGLFAAVFGLVDYLAIPKKTRAKAIGLVHGLGNVAVLALFAGSLYLRLDAPHVPGTWALVLSFAGFGLAAVTGWLGGELVDRLGVGVDDGANLNAPNSLSGKPASSTGGTL